MTPGGSVWRACRTPAGPGTLRITPFGGEIEAQAWGPGAEWLLDRLPSLLGADDEPDAFVPRHRLVHAVHRRHPGLRLCRTGIVLESLIPAVLEQKVTSDEAYRAWRLLLHRHGEPAPGPAADMRMRVMPDPRTWALIPSWEWHRAGVDGTRAATILRAVRAAGRIEEAADMQDAEAAAARLQLIQGIGPWTAAESLQRSNGAPDAITVGDLHLPNVVGYALTGERRTDDARMLELLEPYAGQRHRAARLILLAGRRPPRRAPRFSPNDIRLI
jgi:3-methyladenine DNA glycosylase/8-oxoguanine DNA glycosylase